MVTWAFPPYFGGAAIQAIYLAQQLKENGVDVEFITNNAEQRSKHDNYNGLKVFRCSTFLKNPTGFNKISELIFAIRIFLYVLRMRKFNIIHFHSIQGIEALLFPILRLLGKKVILKMTLIGADDPKAFKNRKYLSVFYLWGMKYVNYLIAISTRQIQLVKESGITRAKCCYIPNGVDIAKYKELDENNKRKLKEQLCLNHYDKIFLTVGKLEDRKNSLFLLDVWKYLMKEYPNAIFLFVGPGNSDNNEYYLNLKHNIRANTLSRVLFTGHINDVDTYMKISDIFLFASKTEGLPNVLIEALATSVPVVTLNIEGVIGDIIQEGNDDIARICYRSSPEDFVHMVISLDCDFNRIERNKRILLHRKKFDMHHIGSQYVELYHKLLSEN